MKNKILTPIKSIRAKCLDCCGGSAHEVKACSSVSCPLFPYRFGVRPTTAQKKIINSKTGSRLMVSELGEYSEDEGEVGE